MNDKALNLVWLLGALVLVGSAVASRRAPIGVMLRSLASWALIGFAVYIGVTHREQLGALLARVTDTLGIDEQQAEGRTVRIRMSPDGHFWARVTLNGVTRHMLIDSGATMTALSDETAREAGIDTSGANFPVMIQTANGTIMAKRGSVEKLALGPLQTRDLSVVVAPSFDGLDVLGMNFLSRLQSWRVENNVLVLEPKREGARSRKARNKEEDAGDTSDRS